MSLGPPQRAATTGLLMPMTPVERYRMFRTTGVHEGVDLLEECVRFATGIEPVNVTRLLMSNSLPSFPIGLFQWPRSAE